MDYKNYLLYWSLAGGQFIGMGVFGFVLFISGLDGEITAKAFIIGILSGILAGILTGFSVNFGLRQLNKNL